MPTIVPPSRDQLGEVIAELESLGGQAKTDFRISHNRIGQAVLEVTDELYEKWESSKDSGPERKKSAGKTADSGSKDAKSSDDSTRKGAK